MVSDKQIKLSTKEGAKKGQDILGWHTTDKTCFFSVRIETACGKQELMTKVMDAMNKEEDPAAEEHKGGGGDFGKMLVHGTDDVVLILCHVPPSRKDEIDQKEWFDSVVDHIKAERVEETGEGLMRATLKADPEKEIFPIKELDRAIRASYDYLVSKDKLKEQESSDDENYADNAGIEW